METFVADAESLQKLLSEAEAIAADLDPSEIGDRARARAQAESTDGELGRLIDLHVDRDWVAPPSVRRSVAAALLVYGSPGALPEASRSFASPDALARALAPRLRRELDAHARFAARRAQLERKRLAPPALERALYALRRKLRAGLQANESSR